MFRRCNAKSFPKFPESAYSNVKQKTIFCKSNLESTVSLDNLIHKKKNWGLLYSVACIYWLEQVLPFKKRSSSERAHTWSAVQIQVDTQFDISLAEHFFERLIISESEQGISRSITTINLSEQGRLLGKEMFTKQNSLTLEHFYWRHRMPKESPAETFEWYSYEPNCLYQLPKRFEEKMENDWLMQYFIQTPGSVLEATCLLQKELDDDIFIQYLANQGKKLYLSFDPKLYPNVDNPFGIQNRKQLHIY